jgi:hypothetical protein
MLCLLLSRVLATFGCRVMDRFLRVLVQTVRRIQSTWAHLQESTLMQSPALHSHVFPRSPLGNEASSPSDEGLDCSTSMRSVYSSEPAVSLSQAETEYCSC